ncbi:phosphatase PAP2 family protein [Dysgonomonas sp. 216]|uniref:phosphatase PAP2 family protein n=1 Tax=Dysgonomonas sp. 216 TaxID=2302934 RepID=UPI0013D7EACA|nr:phosphatase PAP2 family protein [Dysgonomonas sp. 216]NDW17335.1 phosphatase PAP2 family protein [Dysgonomonas sp. 216]
MEPGTSIVEETLPYERDLFLWLNNHHNDFWDSFMMIYSGKLIWVPLAATLLFTIFYKTKWQYAVLFLLCFALLATLCDQISAGVIKPLFTRYRPTHHPDFMNEVLIVDGYKGGRFGFISAHAANGFGVAMFTSLVFRVRWLTVCLFAWALITCYSRIYLGVHFVSDIIGGIMLGSILGYLIYLLYQYCKAKIFKLSAAELKTSFYNKTHANIIMITLGITVLGIILYSLVITYF